MISVLLACTIGFQNGPVTTPVAPPKHEVHHSKPKREPAKKPAVQNPKPKHEPAKTPVVQHSKPGPDLPKKQADQPAKSKEEPAKTPVVQQPTELPYVDKPAGYGLPVKEGDVVVIQFLVKKKTGEDVANSKKRGLPYAFKIGAPGNDPLLDLVVKGMKVGAVRTYTVSAAEVYGAAGALPVIAPRDMLIATVTLLRRGTK